MQPGDHIRDYILERLLGKGGMGEVWLARHAILGKAVAIKAMAEGLAGDAKFRERFISEARAMAALQHPNIVGATDFFEEGGRLFLVMPFVEGRSLADRLDAQGAPLTVEETLRISGDILGALDFAHRKGVIHRDVKPSNILITGDGRGYLTDFGIALMVGDTRKTRTGFSLGTPHYMSPEQIERPKQVDHLTDVYSFGCVLFEMLAGRPPFVGEDDDDGSSDFRIRQGHVMEAPPHPVSLNPAVPGWLGAAVLKALEKQPAMRFKGCGEFAQVLGRSGQQDAELETIRPGAHVRQGSIRPGPVPSQVPTEGRSAGEWALQWALPFYGCLLGVGLLALWVSHGGLGSLARAIIFDFITTLFFFSLYGYWLAKGIERVRGTMRYLLPFSLLGALAGTVLEQGVIYALLKTDNYNRVWTVSVNLASMVIMGYCQRAAASKNGFRLGIWPWLVATACLADHLLTRVFFLIPAIANNPLMRQFLGAMFTTLAYFALFLLVQRSHRKRS